jgi:FtsH-binding integral membrane protein
VFFLSFRVDKMSVGAAQLTFWIYAALVGTSLAVLLMVYTHTSIARVFFMAAATFGALSLYGYTTKRDLSGMATFLFMGLIGVIIASLVNIWLASSMMQWIISIAGLLVFAGFTAYDTQDIKNMYDANDDGTVSGRKSIMGALRLYLDFLNIFLFMLQLFGNRE